MAGYSGTPLIRKIGIKPGHRVHFHSHPRSFVHDLGELPEAASVESSLAAGTDVMVAFVETQAELLKQFVRLSRKLAVNGMLLIAWPKKASGHATDLTENVVRDFGLKNGLVDVKVCAIDNVWSGLKFVIRLKDRPASAGRKAAPAAVAKKRSVALRKSKKR
jgi:hypothetical protein